MVNTGREDTSRQCWLQEVLALAARVSRELDGASERLWNPGVSWWVCASKVDRTATSLGCRDRARLSSMSGLSG